MNDDHRVGYEPRLHDDHVTGLEPQLGRERGRIHHAAPLVVQCTAEFFDGRLSYRLEDAHTGRTLVRLGSTGAAHNPFEPKAQSILVRGDRFGFKATRLSARLDGPQTGWRIDFVSSLSCPTRIEWVFHSEQDLPVGAMRLSRSLGRLELFSADSRAICRTAVRPCQRCSACTVVHLNRLPAALEPLFLVALLFGWVTGHGG